MCFTGKVFPIKYQLMLFWSTHLICYYNLYHESKGGIHSTGIDGYLTRPGSIPGLGRSPGEENGYPRQYSGLENSMDCIVQGVTNSQTRLSDFHSHFHSQGTALDAGDTNR